MQISLIPGQFIGSTFPEGNQPVFSGFATRVFPLKREKRPERMIA